MRSVGWDSLAPLPRATLKGDLITFLATFLFFVPSIRSAIFFTFPLPGFRRATGDLITFHRRATLKGDLITFRRRATLKGDLITFHRRATLKGDLITFHRRATLKGDLITFHRRATLKGDLITFHRRATLKGDLIRFHRRATLKGDLITISQTFPSLCLRQISRIPPENQFPEETFAGAIHSMFVPILVIQMPLEKYELFVRPRIQQNQVCIAIISSW